jgi:hypothetical protein
MNEWETAGSLAVLCSRLHDVIELRVLPAQDWTIWRGFAARRVGAGTVRVRCPAGGLAG